MDRRDFLKSASALSAATSAFAAKAVKGSDDIQHLKQQPRITELGIYRETELSRLLDLESIFGLYLLDYTQHWAEA